MGAAFGGAKKQATSHKKGAPSPGHGVQGTAPLAGDEGKIGTTYTIGQSRPLNFTLKSAEFTVRRINIGQHSYLPAGREKLLCLTYTVQNPNSTDELYDYSSLRFSAV